MVWISPRKQKERLWVLKQVSGLEVHARKKVVWRVGIDRRGQDWEILKSLSLAVVEYTYKIYHLNHF